MFAQILIGNARVGAGARVEGFGVSVERNAFLFTVGGGVIIPLSEDGRYGFRVGADYRRLSADIADSDELRVTAGVSIGFGHR